MVLERLFSLLGLFGLVGVAWVFSVDRRKVRWRPVAWGVALQLLLGIIILLPDAGSALFDLVDVGVNKLMGFSEAGADFVFQSVEPHIVEVPGPEGKIISKTVIGHISPAVMTLAFWILPSVIFFSSLMALLYHWRIMDRLVSGISRLMQVTMKTSGAESLSVAANIFVGQTEAPLVIRPFVSKMTMSELNAVMVGGFATVAGGVLAIYVGVLGPTMPGIAGHLVLASVLSAPAALAIAKVMVPETGKPFTAGHVKMPKERIDVNALDAISRGALEGLKLLLNIGALLMAFVALMSMADALLGMVAGWFGEELTLATLFGWVFSPLALLMGVPWAEADIVGRLLGEKVILTELIAYFSLGEIQSGANPLSPRTAVICSYALCGFANFASIGIQIGGIGGIAPERRGDLARIGIRAMIGGMLAAMMTGAVAGLLYTE